MVYRITIIPDHFTGNKERFKEPFGTSFGNKTIVKKLCIFEVFITIRLLKLLAIRKMMVNF